MGRYQQKLSDRPFIPISFRDDKVIEDENGVQLVYQHSDFCHKSSRKHHIRQRQKHQRHQQL